MRTDADFPVMSTMHGRFVKGSTWDNDDEKYRMLFVVFEEQMLRMTPMNQCFTFSFALMMIATKVNDHSFIIVPSTKSFY